MDPSLRSIDFDEVLEIFALETKTEPGRTAMLARRPSSTIGICEKSQAELRDMVRICRAEGLLPLAGLQALDGLLRGSLGLEESWIVVRAARATRSLRESILRTDVTSPHLAEIALRIPDLTELIEAVGRYFTKDGKLKESASPDLKSARRRIQSSRASIQKRLSSILARHPVAVQEDLVTIRGDRYCVPVKSEKRGQIPGILHERSGSGATLFIEPIEIVELNNDLAEHLIQEREIIARIAREIESRILAEKEEILEGIRISGELDAIQACAVLHDRLEASSPGFSDRGVLELIDGRHPLLDPRTASLRKELYQPSRAEESVVPVTLRLDEETPALVVSGPNAGGKTVTLKTAGLLTAMAAAGLPVPASEGSIFPVVDRIQILIGDEQGVLAHLSTFSGYVQRLRNVLEEGTGRSLVLLDEVGSGTDPEEGSALAIAVVEHLLETGARFIVTTHLASVQTFAIGHDRIATASMEFDSEGQRPTYRMIAGLPGRSRALEIAEQTGLDHTIVERAREILGSKYVESDALLTSLQEAMSETIALRDSLRLEKASSERRQRQLDESEARIAAREKDLSRDWKRDTEQLRSDVNRRLQMELKHLRDLDQREREKIRAADLADSIAKPATDRADGFQPVSNELRVGLNAEHIRFGVTGEVVSLDGDRAVLEIKGRRMTVDKKDLLPAAPKVETERAVRQKAKLARVVDSTQSAEEAEATQELNLIGQRVEEALDESDRFLDQALLSGQRAVRLIHGHGTGRLRAAIRDHLRSHPAVRSFRAGNRREGGDGSTVAVLESSD